MKLFNITLDLDGTVANTYKINNWLGMLENNIATPFIIAEPMTKRINKLKWLSLIANIDVCTWLPPNAKDNKAFEQDCIKYKQQWVEKHLPFVNNVNCLHYGVAKTGKGILIDDSKAVRKQWGRLSLDAQVLGKEYIYHNH